MGIDSGAGTGAFSSGMGVGGGNDFTFKYDAITGPFGRFKWWIVCDWAYLFEYSFAKNAWCRSSTLETGAR